MVNPRGAAAVLVVGVLGCGGEGDGAEAGAGEAVTAPAVEIAAPAPGETVSGGTVVVRLVVRGVEIRPAGTEEPNTGHHHLFVDRDITPAGEIIPAEEGIIHLGAGQTEHEMQLAPGTHTIVAVLGDYQHARLAAVKTDTVNVVVQ